MAQPPALILGFGVHGLAIARSLGRRGIRVDAMDTYAGQPYRFSRFCRALHRVDTLETDALVDALLRYGRAQSQRAALFITMDRTVPIVSAHRDRLSPYFYFNLPADVLIHELMEKSALPTFLDRMGCAYPRTRRIAGRNDLDAVALDVGFPCIVKPATRTYGFKAGVAHSLPALQALYDQASQHGSELIAQRQIPGEDTDVYFCFVYIARDGTPRAVFTGRKLRQLPRGTGIAASAEGCDDGFVREESLRLFRQSGYRGFGSTEFRRDPTTGQYHLIEFTVGRTDYDVGCAIANGVDLPYVGYLDLIGSDTVLSQLQQHNRRRWVEVKRDIRAIWRTRDRSPSGLVSMPAALARTLSPRNAFTVLDFSDPAPFAMSALDVLLAPPRKVFRRIVGRYRV